MRVSLSVLGKVTKHGVLRCINKKVVHVFHREGSYRPPPPRLDRVKATINRCTRPSYNQNNMK